MKCENRPYALISIRLRVFKFILEECGIFVHFLVSCNYHTKSEWSVLYIQLFCTTHTRRELKNEEKFGENGKSFIVHFFYAFFSLSLSRRCSESVFKIERKKNVTEKKKHYKIYSSNFSRVSYLISEQKCVFFCRKFSPSKQFKTIE